MQLSKPTYVVSKQQSRLHERVVIIKNLASGEDIAVQAIQS